MTFTLIYFDNYYSIHTWQSHQKIFSKSPKIIQGSINTERSIDIPCQKFNCLRTIPELQKKPGKVTKYIGEEKIINIQNMYYLYCTWMGSNSYNANT